MKKNICKKCKEQVKRLKHRENELNGINNIENVKKFQKEKPIFKQIIISKDEMDKLEKRKLIKREKP